MQKINLASASLGTQRHLCVYQYNPAKSSDAETKKIYLQAALHADEWPGVLTLHYLIELLDRHKDDIIGHITIVPSANPIGLAQHINGRHLGRFDFDHSGNFNRHYPDLAKMSYSLIKDKLGQDAKKNTVLIRQAMIQALNDHQPLLEADQLRKQLLLLSSDADYVLDLHCDLEAQTHMYSNIRHQDTSYTLADCLDYQWVFLEEEPGGIPFDEANSSPWWKLQQLCPDQPIDLACYSCTLELRGQSDVETHYAKAEAAGLFKFMQKVGIIDERIHLEKNNAPSVTPTMTRLDAVDVVKAQHAGVIEFVKNLGDTVTPDEPIAYLISFDDPDNRRKPVYSETTGIMATRNLERYVRPGHSIAKIAGTQSLTHRQAGSLLEF